MQNVPAGVIKSLIFDLEVETEDNVNFPASMSFTSGQVVLRDPLRVVVDNSENFAPTSGADFFLNPKKRNNSESEPNTIVNAVNNQQVKSTFEVFLSSVMVGLSMLIRMLVACESWMALRSTSTMMLILTIRLYRD